MADALLRMVVTMTTRMVAGTVMVAGKPHQRRSVSVVDQHTIQTAPPLVLMGLRRFAQANRGMVGIWIGTGTVWGANDRFSSVSDIWMWWAIAIG